MADGNIVAIHVDDKPEFADLASTFIERQEQDIVVETTDDPRDCLARVKDDAHRYDCIVSDYDMPGLNGIELLDRLRRKDIDLPFILFTGQGSEEIAADAISYGVDGYIQKRRGTDQYRILADRITHVVTQHRRKRNESKYRQLVERSLVGIYLVRNFEFAYVNDYLGEIFGYEVSELTGQPVSTVVAESDSEFIEDTLGDHSNREADDMRYRLTGEDHAGQLLDLLVLDRRIELNDESAVAGVLLDLADLPVDA